MDKTASDRASERNRRILLSSVSAIGAKTVGLAVSLITVPLTVTYLGAERYGLWMAMTSLIAMLGFADLGMGNGLLNAVANAHGRNDVKSAQVNISSCAFMLTGVALALFTVLTAISQWINFGVLFNIESAEVAQEAQIATVVLLGGFAINLPLSIANRVQNAYQEGYKSNAWSIVGSVMGLIAVIIVLKSGGGLAHLVGAVAFGSLCAAYLNWHFLFKHSRPMLAPTVRHYDQPTSNRLLRVGGIFMLLQALSVFGTMSDNIIIVQIFGASEVAKFAVAQKMFSIALLAQYFLLPLWPAFSEAVARGDKVWAKKTLTKAIWLSMGAGATVGIPLLIFGQRLAEVWAGPTVIPEKSVLVALLAWTIMTCYFGTIATFLNSGELVAKQARILGVASVVSVSVKILACKYVGVWAAIWGGTISYFILYVIPATKIAFASLSHESENATK